MDTKAMGDTKTRLTGFKFGHKKMLKTNLLENFVNEVWNAASDC